MDKIFRACQTYDTPEKTRDAQDWRPGHVCDYRFLCLPLVFYLLIIVHHVCDGVTDRSGDPVEGSFLRL